MTDDPCWVLVESRAGRICRETLEALSAAQLVAERMGTETVALRIGAELTEAEAAFLASLGVRRILRAGSETRDDPAGQRVFDRIETLYRLDPPSIFLLGPTPLSLRLAPWLAARVGAGYACRITNLRSIGGRLVMTRPLAQGALSELLRFASGHRGLICLYPRSFHLPKIRHPALPLSPFQGQEEGLPSSLSPSELSFEVLESVRTSAAQVAVEDADIVVAGGRGMGSKEGFALLEALAEMLGGTVGASRIAVDLGWAPKEKLVGQTGAKVTPDLYIACGISGAHQHLQGMKQSRSILAINTDPTAPIFRVATWGIVADAREVIRNLLLEIRRRENRNAESP